MARGVKVHVLGRRGYTACGMAVHPVGRFHRRQAVQVLPATRSNLPRITCLTCQRMLLQRSAYGSRDKLKWLR